MLPSWVNGVIQNKVSKTAASSWSSHLFYLTLSVELFLLLDRTVRVSVFVCACVRLCVDLISWKDGTLDLPHTGFGSCPLAARRHMTWRLCAHFLCLLFSSWASRVYVCVHLCTSACAHLCVRRALIWREGRWFSAGIWPQAACVVRMNATRLWFGSSSPSRHRCLTLSSCLSLSLSPSLAVSRYLPTSLSLACDDERCKPLMPPISSAI